MERILKCWGVDVGQTDSLSSVLIVQLRSLRAKSLLLKNDVAEDIQLWGRNVYCLNKVHHLHIACIKLTYLHIYMLVFRCANQLHQFEVNGRQHNTLAKVSLLSCSQSTSMPTTYELGGNCTNLHIYVESWCAEVRRLIRQQKSSFWCKTSSTSTQRVFF